MDVHGDLVFSLRSEVGTCSAPYLDGGDQGKQNLHVIYPESHQSGETYSL